MTDPMDEWRRRLQDAAEAFRPDLDAAELAATSRKRRRNAGIAGGLVGVAAVAVALTLLVPTMLRPNAPVLATPLPVPSASTTPSTSSTSSSDTITVPMDGWKHFASKEYPITFDFPKDWVLSGLIGRTAGCSMSGCQLTLSPPKGSSVTPVVLNRNGFEANDNMTDGFYSSPEMVAAIPDLTGWARAADGTARPIVLARSRAGAHGWDYFLAATSDDGSVESTAIAVGDANPLGDRREALFSFGTALDNLGGTTSGEQAQALRMILASARPNPDYHPTMPVNGVLAQFDSMKTPVLGAVAPDASWRTLTVDAAGIRLRYPDDWKVSHDAEQEEWTIAAPSGYQLRVGLARDGDEYFADESDSSVVLGTVAAAPATADAATDFNQPVVTLSGPAEIRWRNGGTDVASAYLALSRDSRVQDLLHFGGHRGVQLGGVGPGINPTAAELDQLVAILASVTTS